MRSAALIRRAKVFLLHPYARAVSGLHIVTTPVEILQITVSQAELGAAVRRALQNYVTGVPHPDPELSLEGPVLEAAKVSSWSALLRGAKEVEILSDDGQIVFRPTQNRGARNGFWHLPELDVAVAEQVSDEDLGAAALRALELSR